MMESLLFFSFSLDSRRFRDCVGCEVIDIWRFLFVVVSLLYCLPAWLCIYVSISNENLTPLVVGLRKHPDSMLLKLADFHVLDLDATCWSFSGSWRFHWLLYCFCGLASCQLSWRIRDSARAHHHPQRSVQC